MTLWDSLALHQTCQESEAQMMRLTQLISRQSVLEFSGCHAYESFFFWDVMFVLIWSMLI